MSDDNETELEQLRRENAALKAEQPIRLKIADKGGLSVYGLGRFPVTLYKEQWVRLLGVADDILAFIEDNDKRLKSKGEAGK